MVGKLLATIVAAFGVALTLGQAQWRSFPKRYQWCSFCQDETENLLDWETKRGRIVDAAASRFCGVCRLTY